MRNIGRIKEVLDTYAWIDLSTVKNEDGSPHNLKTKKDICLYNSERHIQLQPNMELTFETYLDTKRGKGALGAYLVRETKLSCLERLTKGGIDLGVQGLGNDRILEHSSAFANWCLSIDVATEIKKHRLKGSVVKLLFVHWPVGRHSSRTERRLLVDLTDPMCAIGFNCAGVSRIVALVVVSRNENSLRDKYLSLDDGAYRTTVIGHDECITVLEKGSEYLATGVIEVDIPVGLFAKKPADWEWVNVFYKSEPRDQCVFRRRRILAYTLQPLVIAIWGMASWILSFLVIVVLLSIGIRNINYTPLRHPFDYTPNAVWDELEISRFVPTIKGHYVLLPLAFSPAALLVVGVITCWIRGVTLQTSSWWITFATIMLIPVIAFSFITLMEVWDKSIDQGEQERLRREEKKRRLEAEVDLLICTTTTPRKPDVWQLPLGPKTVRFYFIAVKQKVCRGFAAS